VKIKSGLTSEAMFRRCTLFAAASLVLVIKLLASYGTLDVSSVTSGSRSEHVATSGSYNNQLKPFNDPVLHGRRKAVSSHQVITIEVPFKTTCESC
jgi:hypothetical protein